MLWMVEVWGLGGEKGVMDFGAEGEFQGYGPFLGEWLVILVLMIIKNFRRKLHGRI